jgi:hypothetical protein
MDCPRASGLARSSLSACISLNVRGPLDTRGSFDTRSRANCVDALEGWLVERRAGHRPLAAFGSEHDLDAVGSGNALAQSAADAKSAFDNFLQR